MDHTYKIKPLEWDTRFKNKIEQHYICTTPLGYYTIDNHIEKGCTWSYCFDEYHDMAQGKADSVKEAKRILGKEWRDRVRPLLTRQRK